MSCHRNLAFVYYEYGDDLYAYARHLGFSEDTAMDAVHDIFYKLCLNANIYKGKKNLKFYLFRTLKNRLIDIQKENREYVVSQHTDRENYDEFAFKLEVSPEDNFIAGEERKAVQLRIQDVLNSLSERQREIVYLRYIHEYSYEEIAKLMQISIVSCRNLISKAMSKLKESAISVTVFVLILKSISYH